MAHQLKRPGWKCTCSEPWPCSTRRSQLLDDYDGSLPELRLLMGAYLALAFHDLTAGSPEPEVLRRQLVGWLPPRTRRAGPSA
ncbi:hypothetical protein ACQP00_22145 [Dactylosporangium sp. CS-047395]|uniref:hypothetical protein n=1 Tax=Dactylosporangium sp. CS-047395 TaxID=3239936 RepID=UPI003D925750